MPTNSISAKYSRDGYINIYLYDYDFDAYDYPADHHFSIQQEPSHLPDLLPVNDFIMMPEPADLAPVARPLPVKPTAASVQNGDSPRPAVSVAPPKRARMPKPANARRVRGWGSTRCPVFEGGNYESVVACGSFLSIIDNLKQPRYLPYNFKR